MRRTRVDSDDDNEITSREVSLTVDVQQWLGILPLTGEGDRRYHQREGLIGILCKLQIAYTIEEMHTLFVLQLPFASGVVVHKQVILNVLAAGK